MYLKPISAATAKTIYWKIYGYAKDFPVDCEWWLVKNIHHYDDMPDGYDYQFLQTRIDGLQGIVGRVKA